MRVPVPPANQTASTGRNWQATRFGRPNGSGRGEPCPYGCYPTDASGLWGCGHRAILPDRIFGQNKTDPQDLLIVGL